MSVNVLLIGQHTVESTSIIDWLRRAVPSVRHANRMPTIDSLEPDWFPDLVVVLQHWSDEWEPARINELLAKFPLARWVCCYGAWCESDGRNRPTQWPIAVRVPMRRSVARIQRELGVLDGRIDPLPLTASREELFAFDFEPVAQVATTANHAVVSSPDRAYREMLESLLASLGTVVVTRDDKNIDLVVCDIDPWSHRKREFERLGNSHPQAKLVAIATMPTADLVADVKMTGCDSVLPKFGSIAHELGAIIRRRRTAVA